MNFLLCIAISALVPLVQAAPRGEKKAAAQTSGRPRTEHPASRNPVSPLPPAGDLFPQRSSAPIVVVWPPEGMSMSASDGEFILGSVSDPTAPFFINKATVTVQRNGAFLAWLPIHPGRFTFLCTLDLKSGATSFTRNIFVAQPPKPLPETPAAIDADSLWPKYDVDLRPGDGLAFRMRASPGKKARCRLGRRSWQDLAEISPGVYERMQAVVPGENEYASAVECRLSGWSAPRAFSRGRAAISSRPPPVVVVKTHAVLRNGAGEGYMAFPLPGTRLLTAGRINDEFKVNLGPTLDGWIEARDVELLPIGAPPPKAVTGAIHFSAAERSSQVRIALSERATFTVEETAGASSLTLRLFNCVGHTNWIVYDSHDAFIKEASWRQEATGIVAITIRLDPEIPLWGWQAVYEGSTLRLDLRRPPVLAPEPASPLKGLAIVLDPGHMPSAPGAIGPMGTKEMDANLAIARSAAALLSQRGAAVTLTRSSADQEVSLSERPRLAVERKGDLYVSIHNNALSDGENPFSQPRGFSVYYYHPHSLALARHMYRSYAEGVSLPGEEPRYGDLLVARLSAMPAILIENAYMIIPEQEEKLNDPAFRKTLGQAIVAGLEAFLQGIRAKQPRLLVRTSQPQPASAKATKAKPRAGRKRGRNRG